MFFYHFLYFLTISISANSLGDDGKELINWAIENGVKMNKITLKQLSSTNRGFFASENILTGEEILFIPNDILIKYENISEEVSLDIDFYQNDVPDEEKKTLKLPIVPLTFSVWLMQEEQKGKDSKFYEYIHALPPVRNFPIFYNAAERTLLEGNPLIEMTDLINDAIKEDHKVLQTLIPDYRFPILT